MMFLGLFQGMGSTKTVEILNELQKFSERSQILKQKSSVITTLVFLKYEKINYFPCPEKMGGFLIKNIASTYNSGN